MSSGAPRRLSRGSPDGWSDRPNFVTNSCHGVVRGGFRWGPVGTIEPSQTGFALVRRYSHSSLTRKRTGVRSTHRPPSQTWFDHEMPAGRVTKSRRFVS